MERGTQNREEGTGNSGRRRRIVRHAFWFLVPCFVFLVLALPAAAQVNTGLDEFGRVTVLGGEDIRIIVARIIRAFVGLLGIIAVCIVLYGGFLWMTANGAEEKITKAKKILINGAIGLLIVLSAFSIAQ
ncbi:MAG: pilin, partial [bacterium]|nr:pilin [bacterium]